MHSLFPDASLSGRRETFVFAKASLRLKILIPYYLNISNALAAHDLILKPNLNKITYAIEDDGDGIEINGEFPQVVYQWALTTKSLEVRNLEGCTLCLFMFSFP